MRIMNIMYYLLTYMLFTVNTNAAVPYKASLIGLHNMNNM